MKKIIDNDTGEIVEIEEDNDLVERKLYEIGAIDDETIKFLNHYQEVQEEYDNFRFILEKAMRENNISKWQTDKFTVSIPVDKDTGELKTENTTVKFDVDRFKKDHKDLYEQYQKLATSKVGMRITFRKD